MFRRRPVVGGMIAGGATAAIVGHHAAKKQFESMQKAQAAQMQAAQPTTNQSQGSKKDPVQELQKLATLKQQGILTEEEFQRMKAQILSSS